jgi:hypothetical protein
MKDKTIRRMNHEKTDLVSAGSDRPQSTDLAASCGRIETCDVA